MLSQLENIAWISAYIIHRAEIQLTENEEPKYIGVRAGGQQLLPLVINHGKYIFVPVFLANPYALPQLPYRQRHAQSHSPL